MGIQNRDYIRDERPGGGFGGMSGRMSGGPWAIRYLLIANVAVFLLQNLSGEVRAAAGGMPVFVGGITDWLALSLSDLYTVQVWRLVTYGFCHSPGLSHLLFNMFVLWMFGRSVEPILGSREFLAFYLGGVIVSGLCHVAVQAVEHNPAGVYGASGGVMAVVFLTAMTYPKMKVLVMFFIPMDLWVVAVIYAVVDVMGMLGSGSNVAHAAHLGGAAFGVAYKYNNWRLLSLWHGAPGWTAGLKRSRRNPKVRIYQPSDEPIDSRVDGILEKIHQQGEASLTDEEREILKEASRRLKQR